MTSGRFAGKAVLITGAATGIGRATAEYLVAGGASVFGTGLDAAEGLALAADYKKRNLPLVFREADLTDDAAVRGALVEDEPQPSPEVAGSSLHGTEFEEPPIANNAFEHFARRQP